MIPMVDLRAQYGEIQDEIDHAIGRVLKEASFIKGPHLAEFQEQFADYSGARYCIGASSGTSAIHLALLALGIRPGDEVIVPSHTFFATVEPILVMGARPVFADVDPTTYLMDPESVARCITFRTKAIVPVHIYGQMVDMTRILDLARNHGQHIAVIEDCAQAHGATQGAAAAGTVGDMGCFSFYPGKNLGAYGDAGAVITNDSALAERVTKLADHGRKDKYLHDMVGFNYRMDALQAAILNVKLRHLDRWTELRQEKAARYTELLSGLADCRVPITAAGNKHVYHLYVIESPQRGALLEHLKANGISAGVHYPIPVHEQPALDAYPWSADELPHTERLASRILSLPLYPELQDPQIQQVVETIQTFQDESQTSPTLAPV